MDTLTLLPALASLAGIIGVLYIMVIGQKSLPEWWHEKRQMAIKQSFENARRPERIPIRQTPPKRRNVPSGRDAFINLQMLLKARQLYKEAIVDPHPEFDHLLLRIILQITTWVGSGVFVIAMVIVLIVWPRNRLVSNPPPTSTSMPTPITYQILIISPDGTVDQFNCGAQVQLLSDAQIHLAISPLQEGKLEWQSAAQGKLGMNSPIAYTPGKAIGNFDVVSYYRDGAKMCWLLLIRAETP